jgi:hypothetical protein
MSVPNEPDYIVVQVKVGSAYVTLCGIESATVNNTVNTTDRFRRDCAAPAAIPGRKVRVNSKQWDVTGSGLVNVDQMELYENTLGAHSDFRLLYGQYDNALTDGERTGSTVGFRDGRGVMTATNESLGEEGTAEITIAGEDGLSWTAGAVPTV